MPFFRPVYNYSSHYFADVISSMFVVPGGMLVNAMFLYLWRVSPDSCGLIASLLYHMSPCRLCLHACRLPGPFVSG